MLINQFKTGGDRNFGYLAAEEGTKKAVIIDPSYSPGTIVEFARDKGYEIVYVFCTHDHYDHTNGNKEIKKLTGKISLLFGDQDPITKKWVKDDADFPLGNQRIKIIHTPGHTSDSICILVDDAVFTGDTLFVGKVGGTDFGHQARLEYESLHDKLLTLPDKVRVFPGHDYGIAPESTIGNERKTNPFLIQQDFEAFLDLKINWAEYKRKHEIK